MGRARGRLDIGAGADAGAGDGGVADVDDDDDGGERDRCRRRANLPSIRRGNPTRTALCWSAHLMFFKNFPACTFISSYLSIWYTIVAVAYGERHMTSFCDVIVTETQGRVFRGQLQFPQLLLK